MLKTFIQYIAVELCKKQLEKAANIRKMFENCQKCPLIFAFAK